MSPDSDIDVLRETKSRLRRVARACVQELAPARRAASDALICSRLRSLADEHGAACVTGYFSLPDEPRIDEFLCAMIETGRRVFLPRVRAAKIGFERWKPTTTLSRDEAGVMAPGSPSLPQRGSSDPEEISEFPEAGAKGGWNGFKMIVVPGRAFDSTGTRLGRGGGYYDRLLSSLAGCLVVGVAYECQMLEAIPREIHDRPVMIISTEDRCVRVGEQR